MDSSQAGRISFASSFDFTGWTRLGFSPNALYQDSFSRSPGYPCTGWLMCTPGQYYIRTSIILSFRRFLCNLDKRMCHSVKCRMGQSS